MESSEIMAASLILNNNNKNNNLNWNGYIINSNSGNNGNKISGDINNYCNLINQNVSQNMMMSTASTTTASSTCYEMDMPILLKNNYSPEKYPILTFDHLKETIPIFYDFTTYQDDSKQITNIQHKSEINPTENFNVVKTKDIQLNSPLNGTKITTTSTQTSTSMTVSTTNNSLIKTKNLNYVNHKFIISDSENISVKKMITVKQPKVVTTQPQSLLKKSYSVNGKSKENLNGKSTITSNGNKVEITKFYYASNNCMKPIVSPNIISSGIYRSTAGQSNGLKRKLLGAESNHSNSNILIMNGTKGKIVPISNADEEIKAIRDSQKNSGNLIVNIVNMVADKPEITQRAEISHSSVATTAEPMKTEIPAQTTSSSTTTGNISVLKEPKSLIYHNHDTNKKIIYKIVYPEDVNLVKTEVPSQIPTLNGLDRMKVKKYKSPGRPKNNAKNKRWADVRQPVKKPVVLTQPTARTRAGRLSRPPKHVQNYFKGNSKLIEPTVPLVVAQIHQQNLPTVENNVNFVKKERKIPSQYKCKKCNKIYLGYNRMFRHLDAHPDHGDQKELFKMKINKNYYDDSIYQYFIKKLILKSNLDNRSKLLIDEIRSFNKKIKFLLKKLLIIDNTTNEQEFNDHELLKFIDYPVNNNYRIDHNVLENIDCVDENTELIDIDPTPVIEQALQHHDNHDVHHNDHIDYSSLNISLDSNDGDKTNLSDDSLLQSVDEFVKERWKKFISEEGDFTTVVDTQLPDIKVQDTHHDVDQHAPPILDLSLDYLLN